MIRVKHIDEGKRLTAWIQDGPNRKKQAAQRLSLQPAPSFISWIGGAHRLCERLVRVNI